LGGTSSIENTTINRKLVVYPNPSNGKINIDTELNSPGVISIYNSEGKLILNEKVKAGNMYKEYDLGSEPKGLYFINLQTDRETRTNKILIK
jgi:hypothetical protein